MAGAREEAGFRFHTIDGQPYWDERAYYAFTLRQIEQDIEDPSAELHQMALDLVGDVIGSERLMDQLAIPSHYRDWIADSWRRRQPHLYGRLDLAYDGTGPAKLYELNYDTPTSLFEASFFQWQWLEDQRNAGRLPQHADQFNAIHEALVERFGELAAQLPPPLYFSAVGSSEEDRGTVEYLRDCASQAGLHGQAIAIEDIGLSEDGRFTALDDSVIGTLFAVPAGRPDGRRVRARRSGVQLLEPAWKAVLSNRASCRCCGSATSAIRTCWKRISTMAARWPRAGCASRCSRAKAPTSRCTWPMAAPSAATVPTMARRSSSAPIRSRASKAAIR